MVDILMATYNGEKYITKQIESILNQSYSDIRIIIRDDGSSDNTLNIIKSFVDKYPKKIMLIEDKVKCGSSASNFMELTKYATADYVMYCDQDDFWFENKVEESLNKIKELEGLKGKEIPILVYANYITVDENLKIIKQLKGHNQISKHKTKINRLLVQNYVTGCLMIVNKSLYTKFGDFDNRILMHDWWAALIASSLGYIYHLDKDLMYYRQHSNNVVGAVDIKSFNYRYNKFRDKKTRDSHQKYRRQAELLLERFDSKMNETNKITIKKFINLFVSKHKIVRIIKLVKGHYFKSDFIRIIGQLYYI